MPRQLRVEFPGAIYHLMSRGDRGRENIDGARHDFVDSVAIACQKSRNLTKTTNDTTVTTRTVNNLNQITVSGSSYAYGANGNRSSYTGNYSTYVYDDDHNSRSERVLSGTKLVAGLGCHYQLVQRYNNPSFYSGATKTDFTYDGKGRLRRRVEHSWNSTFATWTQISDTRYIYAGMLAIQERNGSNVPEVSYTRGWDLSGNLEGAGGIGGLLARSHGYSSGAWSTHNFYHADGNGNITMMLDSSQATVATYKYDPYGNSFTASGSLASANLYRFSSKLWCANAGFYYYGYRFYDPSLQRWLNRDPIGEAGGMNLYSFSLNNPVNYVDTDGRWVWIPGFALKAFGAEKAIEKGGKAYYGGKSLIECRDSFLDAKERLDDKYGDHWPEWAEEYMDQWQKELAGGFGPQVAPVIQGVPGSTMNPIPRQNTR